MPNVEVQDVKKKFYIQQWKPIIEDRNASGLTVKEYCEQNHLSQNSYYYWLRKIREEIILPGTLVEFRTQ